MVLELLVCRVSDLTFDANLNIPSLHFIIDENKNLEVSSSSDANFLANFLQYAVNPSAKLKSLFSSFSMFLSSANSVVFLVFSCGDSLKKQSRFTRI